jgi:lipoprotein-releasing system permease protein
MIFEWKVALRFLKEGKGQTLFILLGIAVGVGVMVFLNTLITGLQVDLINKTIGESPHISITADNTFEVPTEFNTNIIRGNFSEKNATLEDWGKIEEILLKRTDLTAISPVAEGNAFVVKGGQATTVLLRGVSIEKADRIYNISKRIISGKAELGGNTIVLGKELAQENEILPNDVISIVLPNGNSQSFRVSGIFDLGNKNINETWIIMDIATAQKFLGLREKISKIEL